MQYKIGKITAFNGSNVVTGNEFTDWSNITVNHWFGVQGDNALYDIAAVAKAAAPAAWSNVTAYVKGNLVSKVVGTETLYYLSIQDGTNKDPEVETAYWRRTSLWQIILTVNYVAVDRLEVNYALTKDFTGNLNLPLINPGDIETGALVSRAFNKLDSLLQGPTSHLYVEDFTNIIWASAWVSGSSQGSPALTSPNSVVDHPGIVRLNTSTTSGDNQTFYYSSSVRPFEFLNQQEWEARFTFRLNSVANVLFTVGLTDTAGDPLPTIGYILKFSTGDGDTNFQYQTISAGTTELDSGVAADTDWHTLKIRSTADGKIRFSLDSGAEVISSTNITAGALAPSFSVETLTAASKTLDADYVFMLMTSLVR